MNINYLYEYYVFLPKKTKNINLCLSGGGALGFAHVGAIQALEENNIFPDQISGTSMGAIIGVFYAAGYTPRYMLQLIKEDKLYKLSHLLTLHSPFRKHGFSDHTTLQKVIRELIPHNSFEGLDKYFCVCVTNMSKARYELIDSGGNLDKWVTASASIPGVFEPMIYNENIYTDGGVTNNLPAQCFEKQFKRTIGVDVIPFPELTSPDTKRPYNIALSSIRLMQHANSQEGRDICNYLIEPLVLNKFNEFSFDDYQDIFRIGYETTIKYISTHKDILELGKK